MHADLWLRGCAQLASVLPEQQFNTWIRPLATADVSDRGDHGLVVTVKVPNRFKLDWIRNQYGGRIESVLGELAGRTVRLDIVLAARELASAPSNLTDSTVSAISAVSTVSGYASPFARGAAFLPND